MNRIKDRITLGIISGILCKIPFRCMNALEYHLGLVDIKYGHMESSIFLPDNKAKTREGEIISMLTNSVASCVGGVMLTYILSITGKDRSILKGLGLGAVFWILMFGISPKIGIMKQSKKPIAPILSFFDHIVAGGLCSYIIAKLGDDSLFPNHQKN